LTALPGCTPYVHGYAYTTRQSFGGGASASAPQPVPTPGAAPSPAVVASAAGSSTAPIEATHSELSDQLTYYLQGHRLPLVGAEVASNAPGSHKVILYGYVATEHGKHDAAEKARRFLNDPNAEIDNRIVVSPELREPNPAVTAAASSFPPPATASAGGAAIPPQQIPPAQLNELVGALLLGMAIVTTLPATLPPGPATAPTPSAAPSP
jgi:hypothetical protein